jgi:hypothetical protein
MTTGEKKLLTDIHEAIHSGKSTYPDPIRHLDLALNDAAVRGSIFADFPLEQTFPKLQFPILNRPQNIHWHFHRYAQ